MIERLLEAFFRHAILIILPLVVIPLDVTAAVFATPSQYEAQAGMWVERATYLSYTDDLNRYLSPAQNQKNRLMELLRTRSFVSGVAKRTSLAPLAASASGSQALDQIFARDLESVVDGDHLLVVRFRSEHQALALQVLTAVIEEFKARAAADQYAQATVAISFYESAQKEAEERLGQARDGLAKLLSANPSISTLIRSGGLDAARTDPQFAEAQRLVDTYSRNADQAGASLQRARLDVAAAVSGGELGFRLADAPGVSASPSRQIKKVIMYPIVGGLLAIVLSVALLMFFALSDHSVRSLADLAPDMVILGVLPRFRPRGIGRRLRADVTRRGVAVGAGAVLPQRPRAERVG